MSKWILRFGMLTIFLSSAVIVVSHTQWLSCQAAPDTLDPSGVGFSHCSYFRSNIEVFFLLVGNILVIASYTFEKLWAKRSY